MNDKGRSMVEMLGVLAIIGVLSAGGLVGYSKAMFRQNVNQTIEIFQNFLQRFVELEQKASGSEYFEIDGADAIVKYGLIDHCIKEPYRLGTGCRMPLRQAPGCGRRNVLRTLPEDRN